MLKTLTLITFCCISIFNSQSATVPVQNSLLATGAVAPDFTLEDQDGRKITLSDSRQKSPVVLVFYRGYW